MALAGSTGSIGRQAIDVARAAPERFTVTAIGAHSSVDLLAEQADLLHPRVVALADASRASALADRLPTGSELRCGPDALASLAGEADVVLNAIVGFAGLPVTIATLEKGCRLALANKESLVAAGPIVSRLLAEHAASGAELLPVDSEHAALHQCLRAESHGPRAAPGRHVRRLVLTASGGPFRGRSTADLAKVTREDALAHPTWAMGPKISVDSSTLANKGLEVIEAHELYGVDYDRIEVVVHPQSVVHSAVDFSDGSTIAQLSRPDMRLPIGYALGHPERLDEPYGAINWTNLGPLTFEPPDLETFPCLLLAYSAGRTGGTAPAWFNAANEVAVEGFLAGRVTWASIPSIIERTLADHDGASPEVLADVLAADASARRRAETVVEETSR